MRHNRARQTLGITVDHRKALLANLMQALVQNKKIRTTVTKAKAAGRFADKLITIAKKQTLAARRQLIAENRSQKTAKLLIEVVAPVFKERKGGYTRVLKADNRPGDQAPMAYLEFTDGYELPGAEKKKAKKQKKAKEGEPEKKVASKETKEKKETKEVKESKKADEVKEEVSEEDEKKSSGFLGNLRGFLKGD